MHPKTVKKRDNDTYDDPLVPCLLDEPIESTEFADMCPCCRRSRVE
jgi:hypothetical protein